MIKIDAICGPKMRKRRRKRRKNKKRLWRSLKRSRVLIKIQLLKKVQEDLSQRVRMKLLRKRSLLKRRRISMMPKKLKRMKVWTVSNVQEKIERRRKTSPRLSLKNTMINSRNYKTKPMELMSMVETNGKLFQIQQCMTMKKSLQKEITQIMKLMNVPEMQRLPQFIQRAVNQIRMLTVRTNLKRIN